MSLATSEERSQRIARNLAVCVQIETEEHDRNGRLRPRRQRRAIQRRALCGPAARDPLQMPAEQIGVRDGRRITGRYTVNKDDLVNGARFDDGAFGIVRFGRLAELRSAEQLLLKVG